MCAKKPLWHSTSFREQVIIKPQERSASIQVDHRSEHQREENHGGGLKYPGTTCPKGVITETLQGMTWPGSRRSCHPPSIVLALLLSTVVCFAWLLFVLSSFVCFVSAWWIRGSG